MMIKPALAFAAAAVGFAALPAPVAAQAQDRVLIIYGNDKCPTDKNGSEIVVCSRRPEAERFRIPQTLRQSAPAAGEARWGDRVAGTMAAGAAGTGSCTQTGPGGSAGCWGKMMQQARAERQAAGQPVNQAVEGTPEDPR